MYLLLFDPSIYSEINKSVAIAGEVPTLAQLTTDGLIAKVTSPQPSELPLLICSGEIVAVPSAARFTVMFLHLAVGLVVSSTVMVWV